MVLYVTSILKNTASSFYFSSFKTADETKITNLSNLAIFYAEMLLFFYFKTSNTNIFSHFLNLSRIYFDRKPSRPFKTRVKAEHRMFLFVCVLFSRLLKHTF